MHLSALRYSNLFRNVSATNESGVDQFRRFGPPKLVAKATSLERSENEDQIGHPQSARNRENSVKIDPVHSEIKIK